MIATAVKTYGKVNVLFNNAGISGQPAPTADSTEETWQQVIDINLRGIFLGMKYAIPEMIKAGGGSIINTASIAADVAERGLSIYSASKGGVISMSRVTAVEYAPQNIRVNCIKPGVMATPMTVNFMKNFPEVLKRIEDETPQGRLGKPEEIAQLVIFLASDESSHITGEKITVDGGIEAASHIF